ncbi:MAG: hypothetical protein CSA22_06035 [Deltaproteobacteria bacterium]|nr:MAG: hypothetical protein CSA22_06035 [Deltaproteobacteria bacterium]
MEIVIYFFLNVFIAVIGFYTGEIIIFLLSLGRIKVRWNFYSDVEDASFFVLITEKSIWIGFVFWMLFVSYLVC